MAAPMTAQGVFLALGLQKGKQSACPPTQAGMLSTRQEDKTIYLNLDLDYRSRKSI